MPRKKEKMRNMVKKIARDARDKIAHVNQHMQAAGHARIDDRDNFDDSQDGESENLLHTESRTAVPQEAEGVEDVPRDYSLGSASDLDKGRNSASRVSGGEEDEPNSVGHRSLDNEAINIDSSLASRSKYHFNQFGEEVDLVEMSSERAAEDSQIEPHDSDFVQSGKGAHHENLFGSSARKSGQKSSKFLKGKMHGYDHPQFQIDDDDDDDGNEDDDIRLVEIKNENSLIEENGTAHHAHSHGVGTSKCSNTKALINVLKAYVGSGVLGLPYAYSQGGMMAAFTGMTLISILSTICVFMLLSCKKKLGGRTRSFGDVGYAACGRTGHVLVEFCVVLSQMGFCCAYLIFVGENMYKYVKAYVVKEDNVIWAIVPGIALLCWIPSLEILAPFSLFAVLLIFSGLITVAWNSMPLFGTGPDVQEYIPSTMPIFVGMAIYAFEGIGLAIPIENSMKHPESFPFVWVLGMVIVTITYITFGAFCYSCYGDEVPSIITMVLPDDLISFLVKLGLCIALLFTYPIAIYPVFEIVEEGWCWRFLRAPPPEVLPGHHAVSLQVSFCVQGRRFVTR
eukprot:754694-Hanusia_phi.AAC.7